MKPTDLTGAHRRLFDAFRGGGMTEAAALAATVGRRGGPEAASSFERLADTFVGLGLSEDAACVAAAGRGVTEAEARSLHAAADLQRENAAVLATVRDLASQFRAVDPGLSEQRAQARACARVREAFVGSPHATRVDKVLRDSFPAPASSRCRSAPDGDLEARLREARRRGTGMRVVDANGTPTGRVLTLAEIDGLLGGRS